MQFDETDDVELLKRIEQGDKLALKSFVDRYFKMVYSFVIKTVKDPMMAENTVNTVMLEIWNCAGNYQGSGSVKSWLLGMAKFKAVDEVRRQSKFFKEDTNQDENIEFNSGATADALAALEQEDLVHHCLEELSEEHRAAIHLLFYQDLSYEQIAEVVACPLGTVRSRIFNAKKLLKDCLSRIMKAESE
jgi:RNA polymerase sigma-70 factor (ECF subfamily)